MRKIAQLLTLLAYSTLSGLPATYANDNPPATINQRINTILQQFDGEGHFKIPPGNDNNTYYATQKIRIENCQNYPYHHQKDPRRGFNQLAEDIQQGLKQGLQCLAGQREMGELHTYHQQQLLSLLDLLESDKSKTFRCVEDKMFAFAVANTRPVHNADYPQDAVINDLPFPAVVIDTYRISGYISARHERSVYRDFFKLDDTQITEHLSGNPQWLEGMHRYKNRAGLVFHEMLHWLGHEHTNTYPDVVFLYETCCFAGSDFIEDELKNKQLQQQACQILKDRELWEASRYKQMRLWRYKEYDQLKRSIHDEYD